MYYLYSIQHIDPCLYPRQVADPCNPRYTCTHTHELPWPSWRVWVLVGYRYRSLWWHPGVTHADHYFGPIADWADLPYCTYFWLILADFLHILTNSSLWLQISKWGFSWCGRWFYQWNGPGCHQHITCHVPVNSISCNEIEAFSDWLAYYYLSIKGLMRCHVCVTSLSLCHIVIVIIALHHHGHSHAGVSHCHGHGCVS